MRRTFSLVGLILIALTAAPRSAEADIWDWLQEFSGPGPFHTRVGNVTFKTCPGTFLGKHSWDVPYNPEDPSKNPACLYFDVRTFENRDDDNFGTKVKADVYEVGFERRLHSAIALGFGGGAIHFSGSGISTTKFVLTVPRVEMTPLLLLRSNDYWRSHPVRRKAASLLKYYVRENIVVGTLKSGDFGLKSSAFDVTNDRVASTGFVVDVSEFFRTWTP